MSRLSLAFFGIALLSVSPTAAEPTTYRHQLRAPASALSGDSQGLRLTLDDGPSYLVTIDNGAISFHLDAPAAAPSLGSDALPDTVLAMAARNIAAAWFTEPTRRYAHGVLGDAIEAGGIAARLSDGRTLRLSLDENSVFEDRVPRIVDMNGDGLDEILVVRSYLDSGAALTVVGPVGDKLAIVAEAAAIGQPHRWLNPVGVGDFDGDGRPEAAGVITPHIGGTLQLYEWRGERLVADQSSFGFSNHAMGSRELGLSAIADINADGIPDIILPDGTRRNIKAVTFAGGSAKTLLDVAIDGRLTGPIAVADMDRDGHPEIAYILDGNVLAVVDPTP